MKVLATCLFAVALTAAPNSRAEETFPRDPSPVEAPSLPSKNGEAPGAAVDPNVEVPYIASLDTYGSSRVSEPIVRKLLGKELDEWLKKGVTGDPTAIDLQREITKKLQAKFNFAFIQWSIMQYLQPGDLAIRVTLDVVEEKDRQARMPFTDPPKGKPADPQGLVKKWGEYQETALKLANEGGLDGIEPNCPGAFHCLFGHDHAKLKPFAQAFIRDVPKHAPALVKVLKEHEDGDKRAAAAFLLAYLRDGNELVKLMVDRLKDPDSLVRNNALRVLGDVAERHPEIPIPLEPVVAALDYPLVTDRSKAVFILFALAESQPKAQKVAVQNAAKLIQLLKTEQPNQSGVAHAILRKVSGKNFSPTEIDKWNEWYDRLPASQKR